MSGESTSAHCTLTDDIPRVTHTATHDVLLHPNKTYKEMDMLFAIRIHFLCRRMEGQVKWSDWLEMSSCKNRYTRSVAVTEVSCGEGEHIKQLVDHFNRLLSFYWISSSSLHPLKYFISGEVQIEIAIALPNNSTTAAAAPSQGRSAARFLLLDCLAL